MRHNHNLGRKSVLLPVAATCLIGILSLTSCSSAARQKIKDGAAQAAGIDTLSRQKQPDGSTVLTLNSGSWEEVLGVKPSGDVDFKATYAGITSAMATGTLACRGDVLVGDITSDLTSGHLKRLHVEGISMQPHHIDTPDSQVCDGETFDVQNTDDARQVIKDVFGERALLVSDTNK